MKQLLLRVNDKSRLSELKEFGHVTVETPYSNIICFDCHPNMLPFLTAHPIVESVQEAPVGAIL